MELWGNRMVSFVFDRGVFLWGFPFSFVIFLSFLLLRLAPMGYISTIGRSQNRVLVRGVGVEVPLDLVIFLNSRGFAAE